MCSAVEDIRASVRTDLHGPRGGGARERRAPAAGGRAPVLSPLLRPEAVILLEIFRGGCRQAEAGEPRGAAGGRRAGVRAAESAGHAARRARVGARARRRQAAARQVLRTRPGERRAAAVAQSAARHALCARAPAARRHRAG